MEDRLFYLTGDSIVAKLEPNPTIRLQSPDGRHAVIDFSGDEVTYSGDLPVSEGAKIFFQAVGGLLLQARGVK